MLHMRLKRKSIRSVCISDRTESLRGSHCPLRAARPRDPLDTGGQAKPGARQPNGPVKSRRGSAESCTRIPARNHPGGSILAAIMAQFLTAIDNFPASIFSSHTLVQCERTNNRIRGLVCSHRERRMLFCHMIITVSVRSLSAKSTAPSWTVLVIHHRRNTALFDLWCHRQCDARRGCSLCIYGKRVGADCYVS